MVRACLLFGLAVASEAFMSPAPCSLMTSRRYLGPVTRQSQYAGSLNVGKRPGEKEMVEFNVRSSEGKKAYEAAQERANKLQEAEKAKQAELYTLLKQKVLDLVSESNWEKVDADGSGELDFDEFARAFGGLSEAQNTGFYSNVELLRRLFDELGEDRSNTIARHAILEKMQKLVAK